MTARPRNLDPVLLEVLGELDHSDIALLTPVRPSQLVRGLRDGSAILRPATTATSAAMKELLTVHREELALRLFLAGQRGLFGASDSRWTLQRSISRESPLEIDQWRLAGRLSEAAADSLLRDASSPTAPFAENVALRVLTSGSPGLTDAVLAFEMAIRLVPRESSRIWWALSLLQCGETAASLGILRWIHAQSWSPSLRAIASLDLGLWHWMTGATSRAADLYERAFQEDRALVCAAAYGIWLQTLHANKDSAQQISATLRNEGDASGADFDEAVHILQARSHVDRKGLTQKAIRTARSLHEEDPHVVGRIVETLLRD